MKEVYIVRELTHTCDQRSGIMYWAFTGVKGVFSNEEAAKQMVEELTWEAEENVLDYKYDVEKQKVYSSWWPAPL